MAVLLMRYRQREFRALAARAGFFNGPAVKILIFQHNLGCTKLASCMLPCGMAQVSAKVWIVEDRKTAPGHGFDVAQFVQISVDAVCDDFRNTTDTSGNDRDLARHCFKRDK